MKLQKLVGFLWAVLIGISLVVTGVSLNRLYVEHRQITQDVIGWKNVAEKAVEADQVYSAMLLVGDGLRKWGMTTGYANPWIESPEDNMNIIIGIVDDLTEEALELTLLDKTSCNYGVRFKNLMDSVKNLEIPAFEYWTNHGARSTTFTLFASIVLAFLFSLAKVLNQGIIKRF